MRIARTALLLALAAAAVACEPAAATFPGRNGEIVLAQEIGSKYANQQMSLLRFPPRFGRPGDVPVCRVQSFGNTVHCQHLGRPALTPDGTRMVVSVAEANPWEPDPSAIWILNANGERIERLQVNAGYWDARWAPDESAFLAVRLLDPADPAPPGKQRTGVFLLNRDGSERSLLAADATAADWCADGRVVVAQHGGIRVLELTRPGGSRRLTRRRDAEPSCSPDSRRVAFTRRGAIWTIPLAGGRPRRLTPGYAPVWSPDGRQIAYLRKVRRHLDEETFLNRIGLRRLVTRVVSDGYLESTDPYSDARVQDPDWQPLPPR